MTPGPLWPSLVTTATHALFPYNKPTTPLPRHARTQANLLDCFCTAYFLLLFSPPVFRPLAVSRPRVLLEVLPRHRVSAARNHAAEDGRAVLGQLGAVPARQELRPAGARALGEEAVLSPHGVNMCVKRCGPCMNSSIRAMDASTCVDGGTVCVLAETSLCCTEAKAKVYE